MKAPTVGGQDGWGFRMGGGEKLGGYGRIGREKFFDEVELPLACNLCSKSRSRGAVRVMNEVFLNLKQPHLHTSLRWRILSAAGLDEEAFLAEIDKKAVLSDLHAILYQKLCQVPNQDGRTGSRNGIGKKDFRRVLFDLGGEGGTFGTLLFQ